MSKRNWSKYTVSMFETYASMSRDFKPITVPDEPSGIIYYSELSWEDRNDYMLHLAEQEEKQNIESAITRLQTAGYTVIPPEPK